MSWLHNRKNVICLALALIQFVVTFFTDHLVFEALLGNGALQDFVALHSDSKLHYVICKAILLVALVYLWRMLADILTGIKSSCVVRGVLLYSGIYLIPIIAVLFFKLPQGFLSNDEALIFGEASRLATYTWFYYLTTYYYIVSMMLIPAWFGPILIKVFLQVFVCGYVVYRISTFLKSRLAYGMYLPFVLFPVLAYTTSAHRIPVYYLLYILLLFILVMDKLEGVNPSWHRLFWIIVCGTVLTQWRTEGIYFAVLLPILIFITYGEFLFAKFNNKKVLAIFAVLGTCLIIQYAVTVPQNGFAPDRLSDQADNRMGPFWAYTVTNMYRNGLDLQKNSADMEKIWGYLDKDTLKAINEDLGDINYEDVLALYYPGYTCTREDATTEDYVRYVEGCKSLFINNPVVLLKTRLGAFNYAALPYHIQWNGGGIKGLLLLGFSIFKSVSYNLYIPCAITVIFLAISFWKRRWLEFFIYGGLCCHWFIVFILAPASYFKYYFPIYMTAYFFSVLYLIMIIAKGKDWRQNDSN